MQNHKDEEPWNDSNHGNLAPSQGSKLTVTGTQKTNLAETHHKDLKIAIMKMFKLIKEEWNERPNEDWQYKQTTEETMEIVQDMKVEFNKEIKD